MPQYNDLFLRDCFSDTGVTPVMDAYIAGSPDIIPYGAGRLNTATTPYGPPLIDVPLNNNNINDIYVRTKNNAAGPASGQVFLYYTDGMLLVNVGAWRKNTITNYNGYDYAQVTDVPAGAVAFGDQPFAWNPRAAPNQHFCLLARVQTDAHPNPLPASFSDWQGFVLWIRYNANVAWHNVQVVDSLPAQGYQNDLVFQNLNDTATFYTFTATYKNVPVGSVLRTYALPGPDFPGFDVSVTTTKTSGMLPAVGVFPASYQTLVVTTCVFPGGPVEPPPGATIVVESWGPQQEIDRPEHAALRPFAHRPERLGVRASDVELDVDGRLVPIAAYHVLFSPTAASSRFLAAPRRIFAKKTGG